MGKRLSGKDRKLIIDAWKEGKESEVKEKGFYVMTNKNGKENVRKLKAEPVQKEVKEEVVPKKVKKEEKENIL
jgi:hypothetical protein